MVKKDARRTLGARILRILCWFVLGLLLLVTCALVGGRLYLNEARLTELVPAQLGKILAGRISADGIRWDLPLSISIRGLVVRDPEGVEVLEAKSLEASVVLSRIFAGTLLIEPVRLSGASIRLIPPPEGSAETRGPFTLIDAFMPKTPSPPSAPDEGGGLTIRVADANFSGVSVFADLAPWTFTVEGLSLESGALEIAPETLTVGGGLRVPKLVVQNRDPAPGQPAELGPIHLVVDGVEYGLDLETTASTIELGKLGVELPGASLSASGRVQGVPANVEGELDMTARARLAEPWIAAFIPEGVQPLKLRGEAELRVHAEGSLTDAQIAVDLGGATLGAFDLLPIAASLRARTTAERLTIEPLRVSLPDGAWLEASASVDGLPGLLAGQIPFERVRLRHKGRVVAHRLPVRALGGGFTDPSVLPEVLTATITAEGPSLTPIETRVELRADVEGIPSALTQGFVSRLGLALDAEVAPDHARISSLRAEGDGLLVDVAGRVPFDPAGSLDAHVRIEHRNPSPALVKLGSPVTVDRVELDAVAEGPLLQPVGSGSFVVDGIRSEGLAPARLHGDLRWDRGTLVVDRARIDATVGRAIVDARIGLLDAQGQALAAPDIFADARLTQIPLGLITRGQVTGGVSASAQFLGTPEQYELRALIDGGGLQVQGATIAYTPIRVEGNQSAVVLSPMRVLPPGGGALEVEGRVDVPAQRFVASARIIDIPVAVAREFAPETPKLAGVISGRLRAGGDFARPSATATVSLQGLVVGGEAIGDLRLDAATNSSSVAASLSLRGEAGRLEVDAVYPLDGGDLDVRVRGAELAIGKLPGVEEAGVEIDGRLGIDLFARGPLPEPKVHGSIGVRDFELDGEPFANGRVELALTTPEPAHYAMNLRAFEFLTASATVTPVKGGPAPVEGHAEVELRDLDLAAFVPSLGAAGLAARVSARADLDIGRGKVPVSGRLTIPSFEASFGKETLSAAEPIVVSYDGKTAKVEALTLAGTSGTFRARGQVDEAIDLTAQGDLQLAFIQPFVPAIAQISGRIRVDARARGPLDGPQLSGQVALLEPGRIRPRGGLREIALDAFELSLSPTLARLGTLRGRLGGGKFTASGDIGLKAMTPTRWNLDLDAESIPFRSEDVLVEGDVHLRARGATRVPRLEGDIAIVRGRYAKKFRLQDFVFVAKEPRENDAPAAPPPPWLSELVLDLHAGSVGAIDVKVDAQIFAMDVALTADLFIRGTAAAPRIEGRVSTEEGKVRFPATELEVTTANIDFVPTPSSGIRPLIDITAQGEATLPPTGGDPRPTPYEITMRIKGPPEAMQLELSSTPSLPQDQVLSLVILGQVDPSALLAGSPGPKQDRVTSSLVFAGSQLAAPVTHLVEKALDKALNLELELGAEVSSESVRVTAARELTSRVRIEGGYERSLTDDGTATSGRALLFLSSSIFFEGTAQTVSGFTSGSAQALNTGTSGTLELKLRVLGN